MNEDAFRKHWEALIVKKPLLKKTKEKSRLLRDYTMHSNVSLEALKAL